MCGPATWNTLPTELRTATVCPDTFGKKTENLFVQEQLLTTESALDDTDCLFCAIQMRVLIDRLIDYNTSISCTTHASND